MLHEYMDQKLIIASLFYTTSVYYGVMAHIPSEYGHFYLGMSLTTLVLAMVIRFELL